MSLRVDLTKGHAIFLSEVGARDAFNYDVASCTDVDGGAARDAATLAECFMFRGGLRVHLVNWDLKVHEGPLFHHMLCK